MVSYEEFLSTGCLNDEAEKYYFSFQGSYFWKVFFKTMVGTHVDTTFYF